jgi:hypothetical protein
MSINPIGSSLTAQTQAAQYDSIVTTSAGTDASSTAVAPGGGAFIGAIASALSDIGVNSASSTDAASTGESTDPANAVGDFLQTLMETLHSQGGGHGHGGPHGAGGPPAKPPSGGGNGGIASDLQNLIKSLGSANTDSTSGTEAGTSSGLSDSFKNLLGELGIDNTDAGSKLSQFLQTLASRLESSGTSGNLVNTTA